MTTTQLQPTPSGSNGREPTRMRDATRAQWLVFASAFLGWMFDTMDLSLFTFVLAPAVRETSGATSPATIGTLGGVVLGIKLIAWGLGGAVFGFVADRFGRARTMTITIAIYAVFTAVSALATNWVELAAFQAIAGIGIGGEWAAGAALISETWPKRLRAKAMQLMQMAFAFGFIAAATINLVVGPHGWRWVFAVGVIPVVLTFAIRRVVKEPDRWVQAQTAAKLSGSRESSGWRRLGKADLRRPMIVGILISLAMMVGSWGGLTWLPSWIAQLLAKHPGGSSTTTMVSEFFMIMMLGAIVGYLVLIPLVDAVGRRWSYFLFCAGSLVSSLVLFTSIHTVNGLLAFAPVYGFFVIGGFGTFALYLPELFPTVVRASGQGIAWNGARALTGVGILVAGTIIGAAGGYPQAAAWVSLVFVIGLGAIWFGPETKGRELQDV